MFQLFTLWPNNLFEDDFNGICSMDICYRQILYRQIWINVYVQCALCIVQISNKIYSIEIVKKSFGYFRELLTYSLFLWRHFNIHFSLMGLCIMHAFASFEYIQYNYTKTIQLSHFFFLHFFFRHWFNC